MYLRGNRGPGGAGELEKEDEEGSGGGGENDVNTILAHDIPKKNK